MLAEVSEAAVTLLEHLSKVEANAEIVVQGRAIPAMVDSMKEHRTVVAVLLPALRYGTLDVYGPHKSNRSPAPEPSSTCRLQPPQLRLWPSTAAFRRF